MVCWNERGELTVCSTLFYLHVKKIKRINTIETKCETNKVHDEQSYDKKSLSDKNQLLLLIKRTISLWTAMEINLAMFTMYKWQSIKLLWNKCKFSDFSILMMTSKTCGGMQCFLFGSYEK